MWIPFLICESFVTPMDGTSLPQRSALQCLSIDIVLLSSGFCALQKLVLP